MEKFFRTYAITFKFGKYTNGKVVPETDENLKELSVGYPFTVELAIGRSISTFSNKAILTIYGLGETTRKRLAKARYDNEKYISMDIKAGYNGNEYLVYRGAIQECFSFRNGGETEYRTIIESADAAMDLWLGGTSTSFSGGVDVATIINNLNSQLIDLHIGTISPSVMFSIPKRGVNFTGSPIKILRSMSEIEHPDGSVESQMSIDLGEINFIKQSSEVMKKYGILNVDDSYGLLGTPRRRDTFLSLTMLFEPAANLNQECALVSKALGIGGIYKIMGVSHNGVISGAKCGTLTTTLDLYLGVEGFKGV